MEFKENKVYLLLDMDENNIAPVKCVSKEDDGLRFDFMEPGNMEGAEAAMKFMEFICEVAKIPEFVEKFTAEQVIHNKPATIVIWADGTKTVVKCDERDTYDPMKGLALCYMKKARGNTSRGLNDALRAGMSEIWGNE